MELKDLYWEFQQNHSRTVHDRNRGHKQPVSGVSRDVTTGDAADTERVREHHEQHGCSTFDNSGEVDRLLKR